ncbi:MAG: hypothetical protein J6Z12_05070 [Paludibacteraceae bacterium]|nr:hypothetical protein [Paludibacteraceae bacterium]
MQRFYASIFFLAVLLGGVSLTASASNTPDVQSPVAAGMEVRKPAAPGIVCVYPNLGGCQLYVEASCPLECVLYDAEGHVLLDCTLKVGITLLDTSRYQSGRYLLKAGTETFTIDI